MTDFEALKDTFFEEADERLAELETELSRILVEGPDSEGLNAIFRTAHSIKAGAAAFKFKQLVEFAHIFEAVLDLLRSSQLHADENILKLMMEAGDVLADLVDAARDNRQVDNTSFINVQNKLSHLMKDDQETSSLETSQELSEGNEQALGDAVDEFPEKQYEIVFNTKEELFLHANEPIFIARELGSLGDITTHVDTSKLPELDVIDPKSSYLNWNFNLKTDKSLDDVNEVFEFVLDDCDLEIKEITHASSEVDERKIEIQTTETISVKSQILTDPTTKSPKVNTNNAAVSTAHKTKSIRVDLQRIDKLVNMVGEIVIIQSMLSQMIQKEAGDNNSDIMRGIEDLALHTRELQESVMAVRMQPVGSLFARVPRVVRDLSRRLGKDIELLMCGEETEIDKTVIEEIGDPINHLLRNAIDHGIEKPEEREKSGKPRKGTIQLIAEHRGGTIVISIKDDGGGIKRDLVLNRAIERGIVEPNAQLSTFEIENLIFSPGFSTASEVTDVSGRGVGLDVVKRNIENLGGRVSVSSKPGKGTTFTLILPLTLAVLDGMIVNVGEEKYVIPLTSILESFRPSSDEIYTLPDKRKVVSIRGQYYSLVYLGHVFKVPNSVNNPDQGLVILVETERLGTIGLVVDDIEGQQQVVIKSLEENYDPVLGISAATILGDGKVALILDIDNLKEDTALSDDIRKTLQNDNMPYPDMPEEAYVEGNLGTSLQQNIS